MADVNEVYQSQFLRAAQLGGAARPVTIEGAEIEVLGQGEKAQQKIVLRFKGCKPRLALNRTNASFLASAWGPDTQNWLGRIVELRCEKVMFAGSLVDSIRCYLPMVTAPAVARVAVSDAPASGKIEDMTSDVPW